MINCLGYNDALERIIGVSRTALGLFAFALSENKKQKIIAAGQVFRGILEMMGNFENYLLAIDIVFTVYNIGHRVFFHKEPEPEMG